MKLLFLLSLYVCIIGGLGGCKNSKKKLIQIKIGEAYLEMKNKCYCSIKNTSVISELADTIEYTFDFKDVVKIDTMYNTYVIISVNSHENMSRKIYWRDYISDNEKKRLSREKQEAVFNFTKQKDYQLFIEKIHRYAKKCNALLIK